MIHWFNPENDLALAAGTANFTAPKAARALHDAGAVLPLWYGKPGDAVLCYGVNADWLDRVTDDFNLPTHIFDHIIPPDADTAYLPSPWAWSAYARRFFVDEHFPEHLLPTPEAIDAMRMLSHRRTAAVVATDLNKTLPNIKLATPAIEFSEPQQLEQYLAEHPDSMLKAPWSSSGRGVTDARAVGVERALTLGSDSIRRQGSVLVEKAYDKTIDFASLFECVDGECRHLGTSVFTTDAHGAYTGNLLANEQQRRAEIGKYYDTAVLAVVIEHLRVILQRVVAPAYNGVLGVDMLVANDGTLLPVVEINLRKTMGYVANRFADLYMPDGATGIFEVKPTTVPIADDYTVNDGLLTGGTLNLVPPQRFSITATLK